MWCLAVDFCFADDGKAVDVIMFAELFIGWVGDWIVAVLQQSTLRAQYFGEAPPSRTR